MILYKFKTKVHTDTKGIVGKLAFEGVSTIIKLILRRGVSVVFAKKRQSARLQNMRARLDRKDRKLILKCLKH